MDWLHLWNLEATSMFFYCLINKLVTVVHILYTLFLTKHQTYKDSIPDKRVPGIGQFSCLLRKLQKVEVKEERNGGTFDFPTRQSKCLQTSLSLHSQALYTSLHHHTPQHKQSDGCSCCTLLVSNWHIYLTTHVYFTWYTYTQRDMCYPLRSVARTQVQNIPWRFWR